MHRISFALICLIAMGGVAAGCGEEPRYQDVPASAWVRRSRDVSDDMRTKAFAALLQLEDRSPIARQRLIEMLNEGVNQHREALIAHRVETLPDDRRLKLIDQGGYVAADFAPTIMALDVPWKRRLDVIENKMPPNAAIFSFPDYAPKAPKQARKRMLAILETHKNSDDSTTAAMAEHAIEKIQRKPP